MSYMQNNAPLYMSVIEDIESKINNGIYRPGDRIPSLNQICNDYHVSKITAVRAIHELQNSGLVSKVVGKGTFVTGMKAYKNTEADSKKIKRIAILSERESTGIYDKETYYGEIAFSASECALKKSLETRIECFRTNKTNQRGDLLSSSFQAKLDEGLIVIASRPDLNVISMMIEGGVSSVAVDLFLPGKKCILHDNYDGISSILERLSSQGAKKILLAGRFGTSQNSINENERLEAFMRETEQRKLIGEIATDSNYNNLLKRFMKKTTRPDAMIFTQDSPAMKFIEMLKEKHINVPGDVLVAGFDDYPIEAESFGLTTYHVDRAAMGQAAVDYLLENNDLSWQTPLIKRIKGKLIIRNTA